MGHPEGRLVPSFRSLLAASRHTIGLDVMIVVGLMRYGLDFERREVVAFLKGHGTPLSEAAVSYLAVEFLVRWQMFCEERLASLAPRLAPIVLQIDGTVEANGPVTFRAREARTGITLAAEQLVVESLGEVVGFLERYRERFGAPAVIVRDLSATLKGASEQVFPGVPQQVDHFHFVADIGEALLRPDYEALRQGLLAGSGLARLAEWSRTLPIRGRDLETLERLWVRLALEWIDAARTTPGGFPFHLAYLEVAERMRWVAERSTRLLTLNVRRRVAIPEVARLKQTLEGLLDRASGREPLGRLRALVRAWEEVRRAMKIERDRRSREELREFTAADVVAVKAAVERQGRLLASRGLEEAWAKVERRFEEQAPYLWVAAHVPGLSRTTVDLERAHRSDRQGIRHRTGQKATGPEMGRIGSLLAMFSNLENDWFSEKGCPETNLWAEFARQGPREVRRRIRALRGAGRRERVPVAPRHAKEQLDEFVEILEREGPSATELGRWASRVSAPQPSPVV